MACNRIACLLAAGCFLIAHPVRGTVLSHTSAQKWASYIIRERVPEEGGCVRSAGRAFKMPLYPDIIISSLNDMYSSDPGGFTAYQRFEPSWEQNGPT